MHAHRKLTLFLAANGPNQHANALPISWLRYNRAGIRQMVGATQQLICRALALFECASVKRQYDHRERSLGDAGRLGDSLFKRLPECDLRSLCWVGTG